MTNYQIGVSLALCVVCFFAVAAVTTRRIRSVHFSVVQFYLCLLGFIISTVWLIEESMTIKGPMFAYNDWRAWVQIIGASFCHFTA